MDRFAQIPVPGLATQVVLQGNQALLSAGQGSAGQILVFDLTDPAHPQVMEILESTFDESLRNSFSADGAYLAVASRSSGIQVWKVKGQDE